MTRVAGANPRIWIDIFLENAEPVRAALGEHREQLDRLEQALESGDAGFLAKWIGEAAGNRTDRGVPVQATCDFIIATASASVSVAAAGAFRVASTNNNQNRSGVMALNRRVFRIAH